MECVVVGGTKTGDIKASAVSDSHETFIRIHVLAVSVADLTSDKTYGVLTGARAEALSTRNRG